MVYPSKTGLSSLGVLGLSAKNGNQPSETPTYSDFDLRGSIKYQHAEGQRGSLKEIGKHSNSSTKPKHPMWYLNKTTATILMMQALYAVLFTAFVRYSSEADAGEIRNSIHPHLGGYDHEGLVSVIQEFTYVSSYLFICLSFPLIRVRNFHFGFFGEFVLVICLSIEWAILVLGFMNPSVGRKVSIGIDRLITCEYSCVSVMISYLSLVGRTSLLQLSTMQFLHIPLQVFATHILDSFLQVNDEGKTMTSHIFGAFYGVTASLVLFTNKDVVHQNTSNEDIAYQNTSNKGTFHQNTAKTKKRHLIALLGMILILVYWPNICVSQHSGDAQRRIIINTYSALISATIVAFPVSTICNSSRKFCAETIYDAVIGSSVTISSVALLAIEGYGPLLIGATSSAICICIRNLIAPKVAKLIGFHDSCGVFITHGLAGVIGGLLSSLLAAVASPELGYYGYRLYNIYPARSPIEGSGALREVHSYLPQVPEGKGRSAAVQAAMQLLGLVIVILIAATSGAVTGLLLRLPVFEPLEKSSAEKDSERGGRRGRNQDSYEDIKLESQWKLEDEMPST